MEWKGYLSIGISADQKEHYFFSRYFRQIIRQATRETIIMNQTKKHQKTKQQCAGSEASASKNITFSVSKVNKIMWKYKQIDVYI